jgi:hypothetical protein
VAGQKLLAQKSNIEFSIIVIYIIIVGIKIGCPDKIKGLLKKVVFFEFSRHCWIADGNNCLRGESIKNNRWEIT